eukprot:31163_1
MPSVDMMNTECCKYIVHDIQNILNPRVSLQLKWASSKPLQLIDIKELIDQYATEITTIALKTQIDEDKPNSIIIYCSTFTKHKMKSRFGIPIKLVESSKTIVYGFIREMEKQRHFSFIVPQGICDVCCMFYDCFIEIPPKEASPFTILFAIFDLQFVLSING